MIKTKTLLEVVKDGKVIQLYCDPETGLGTLHDALHEMKAYVVERINEANIHNKEQSEEKA